MIAAFIYAKYKPLYKVTLNGEVIGYVENKKQMQEKIKAFENQIEGNITSIKIGTMPEYKLEFVSNVKEADTKETEVLAAVKENSEIKCRVYAIKLDDTVKACVDSQEEAEQIIQTIKSETMEDIELNLQIEEQEQNKKQADINISSVEVAKLAVSQDVEIKVNEYQKQKEQQEQEKKEAERVAALAKASTVIVSSRSVVGSSAVVPAGTGQFMRPVYGGTITSVYGRRSSGFHTGLDIAISLGTPIYASASGTVTFSGRNGGYGNLIIIDHGDGYQTYYAHCNALYVSSGTYVMQGQNIAEVGSTGNSTGPHIHFEVRYNGSTLNPQNYI